MSRPVRVVEVIARMNVGGPAILLASMQQRLDPASFDVRLLTGYCADDEADYLETMAPHVPVERIDGLGRSIRPGSDVAKVRLLAERFRQLRPDIIHTHTAKAGVVGRVAAKLARVDARLVHSYHGHLLHGYFSPTKTKGVVAIERTLARVTDRLVAVAPGVRDDLLAAHVGRAGQYRVIGPGVELLPLPGREEARTALGLPRDAPVVSMIGRLTGIKRPDRFAEAAALVHARRSDVVFAVAGAGDRESDLRSRVSGLPVTLLGWRSDVETVLAASDVVVLTSDNEGTPLSLIQAGLAGLPVVATDVGAVRDVVEDGVTGILCDADSLAVADAICRILDDPVAAGHMGGTAQRLMAERFSMASMIRAHEALYEELARGS